MPIRHSQPKISIVQGRQVDRVRRRLRRPSHKFNLVSRPYAIVPFLIAPVLPGETMTNLLLQSRAVTDPINNALIGWHKEYYFFYIKHRALNGTAAINQMSPTLQAMMLDTATSTAALKAAANSVEYYTFKTGMNYVSACLEMITEEYFRDEGEAHDLAVLDTYYPQAQIDQESWIESLKLASAGADDPELPGVDEEEELDILPGFTSQYAQWEMMRDLKLTDLTYEDYLRSYGVDIPKSEDEGGTEDVRHRPELLRFSRNWTYPTNTVNPADGVPASACSWSIAERADKHRFFKEPGFIFGVTVTRPKIYLGNQKGAAVGLLDSAYGWLPAVLSSEPYTSVDESTFSATDGILQNQASNYWVDLKDLYLYGDQFVNAAMTVAANHGIALPSATMDKRFMTSADITALFKTAGTNKVREDGLVSLSVLGRQTETT